MSFNGAFAMPLLESFTVDHTLMPAPAVRKAKDLRTANGDIITVYDLRFTKPNVEKLPEKGMHTLEHLFAGFMREHLKVQDCQIIDISPMGCRTGFYMSVTGCPGEMEIAKAWKKSMQDILQTEQIPEANLYQCGSYLMHSLSEAKNIATNTLNKKIEIMDNDALKLNLTRAFPG